MWIVCFDEKKKTRRKFPFSLEFKSEEEALKAKMQVFPLKSKIKFVERGN